MTPAIQRPAERTASRIVKSTAVIGVSNAISTVIRIVRMKVFAILLGPAGIGLIGVYNSVMSTTASLSGMGVGSSGVREVAQANGESRKIASTLFSLRLVTVCLGILGAASLIFLSRPISRWTFGNYSYAIPIAILSLGVLFQIVSDSQNAVLSGLRRVRDIALVNIVGTTLGTIFAIVIVWWKGTPALSYAVVVPVMCMLGCSWWTVRRIHYAGKYLPWPLLKIEVMSLLRLGIAFMLAGLMMTGALLFTRLIFVARLGLAATGIFQAAWGLAVINIDFILNAMGIDFYPHLTGSIHSDRAAGNSLVNEQTEVALLLGGPLIIGMLTASGILVRLFYSAKFATATELLRWLLLGSILKIISWPMGYLIMAHGWAKASVISEFVWCSSYVTLIYLGCYRFGVDSAGYAFVAAYLIYLLLIYGITHFRGGFDWSRTNLVLSGALFTAGITVMTVATRNSAASYFLGAALTVTFGLFSLKRLSELTDHPVAKRLDLFLRRGQNTIQSVTDFKV